jgi:beta-glucanase (GH16 family)
MKFEISLIPAGTVFSRLTVGSLVIGCLIIFCPAFEPKTFTAAEPAVWKMVWSDEFNGADHSPIDASKWTAAVGGNGWGNQELEYYTNRIDNAYQSGGSLVIKAIKESYTGGDNVVRAYTSARLTTKDKFTTKYGRFEARIRIPFGQGLWPAFWMLGDNIGAIGWPACGEIDIMENIGKEPSMDRGIPAERD